MLTKASQFRLPAKIRSVFLLLPCVFWAAWNEVSLPRFLLRCPGLPA
jgi:hypothetical protein